jgi:outer membrane protein insertion porin family
MGDGQYLYVYKQVHFQTYSVSFSEPWFGQKKPVQFSSSISYSKQFSNNFHTQRVDKTKVSIS